MSAPDWGRHLYALMKLLFSNNFTGLTTDVLALITNAFAFVRLSRTKGTRRCGKLGNLLFVDSSNHCVSLVGADNFQAFRNRNLKFIRHTNTELEDIVLDGADVTNTNQFKTFLVTLSDSDDHILDHGTCHSVESAALTFVIRTINDYLTVFDFYRNEIGNLEFQLSFRAFNCDFGVSDCDGNSGGHSNRFFSNTRHCFTFAFFYLAEHEPCQAFPLRKSACGKSPNLTDDFAADLLILGLTVT